MDQILLKEIPKEKDYPIAHLLRISDMQLREGKKGNFLQFSVGDRSTQWKWCKKWDSSSAEYNKLKNQEILFIKGKTDVYNDNLQVVADSLAIPEKVPENLMESLIPCTPYDLVFLKKELWKFIQNIENKWIKQLLEDFIKDPEVKEKMSYAFAAVSYHHSYRSGLITHIVRLMYIAEALVDAFNNNAYPNSKIKINKDIVIAACFLHDLYKMREYSLSGDYENYGNLVPHLPLAAIELNRKADNIEGFPDEIRKQLTHVCLSHHGQIEWGSPVTPCTLEAVIFSHIDNMAAKIDPMLEELDDLQEGEVWTERLKGIGKRAYLGGMLLDNDSD